MGRLTLRILFLLSLAFNAACLAYLLTRTAVPAVSIAPADLTPASRVQMRHVREKFKPQYAHLQNRLADAQARLLVDLRADPVDARQIEVDLQDISAIQLEWQRATVTELLQCKRFLSSRDNRCLLDHMGVQLGVSSRCNQKVCPRESATAEK